MNNFMSIKEFDPELYESLKDELNRQREHIELIASENFVSENVLAVAGSHLTNKYAEGYPGKRYYGGCKHVDVAETLAIERVKQLFGAEHANVQPHSGANANIAVYFAMLKPGDTIMGMNLAHGGHLTHGSPVNFSGRYFNVVPYGVSQETETIDYSEMLKIAKENKPKIIVCGASAYPRAIDFLKIREICDEVGALMMADIAHIAGLVISGDHASPFPFADFVTTTSHKTLRGPRGGVIMCKQKYAKDIDKAIFPGLQGGPLMHIIAAKAVAFKEAMQPEFKEYIHNVVKNSKALAAGLMNRGVKLVSNGTDNHLMLLDLTDKGITGKELEQLLDAVHITANKNTIPFETNSPFITSGIRLGTPSVTTRGMNTADMDIIAQCIVDVIEQREACSDAVTKKVMDLCAKYPLYQ